MSESLTIDFDRPIPLFPLQHCLLLPHGTIPLHIFEPRYRAMLRDALNDNALIAMATFEGEHWRDDYDGKPPIKPVVCVGYVVRHQQMADGRSNLLLQGLCRAELTREIDHEPYRMAYLKPIETQPTIELGQEPLRERLERLLNDPDLRELTSVAGIHNWLNDEIPTHALVDLVTMSFCTDSQQRYAMLAETDLQQRGAELERRLERTRRTMSRARPFIDAIEDEDRPRFVFPN